MTKMLKINNTHPGMFLGYGGTGAGFGMSIFHYTNFRQSIQINLSQGIDFFIDSVKNSRIEFDDMMRTLITYQEVFPDLISCYEILKLGLVINRMDLIRLNYQKFEGAVFKFKKVAKIEGWKQEHIDTIFGLDQTSCNLI